MLIMLDLNGWRKSIAISPEAYQRGYVEIQIYPPLSAMIQEEKKIPLPINQEFVRVQFFKTGNRSDGLIIFEYENNDTKGELNGK